MKSSHTAALAACVLSLLTAPSVARAEDNWDIDLTLGTNVAAPTSTAPTFVGPRIALGLRVILGESDALGIVGRAHLLFSDVTQEDLSGALSYRHFWSPSESVRLLLGASAGVGLWPECVHVASEDTCGGLGAALGGEAGLQIPVTEDVAMTAGLEFIGRIGASDIKGMMMMPGGWVGIAF
jgi:hypothetical protein